MKNVIKVGLEGYTIGAFFDVGEIINGRESAAVELSIITKALKPYKTNKQQHNDWARWVNSEAEATGAITATEKEVNKCVLFFR